MATSEDMAQPESGLDHGGANGAGNLRPGSRGKKVDGPGADRGTKPQAPTDQCGRVAVADGENGPAPLAWDRSANIHTRMVMAQAMARALATTKPASGAGAKFKEYVSHDTVAHEGRRLLVANGILYQPILKAFTQDGNRSKVELVGRCFNVDKPDEYLDYDGIGFGIDGSDKGPGIAMAYAKKMALSNALLLNTKEDAEEHSNEYVPQGVTQAQRNAEELTDLAVRQWADGFRDALRGAPTLKELKRIRAEHGDMMKRVPEATREYFMDMIAGLEGTLE